MLGAAVLGLVLPGAAQACSLALALALDVSSSVDEAEFGAQRDGLAAALSEPSVRAAFMAQPGGVALAAYTWSGTRQQTLIVDWTMIGSETALDSFAGRIAEHERKYRDYPTAIGYALGYGATLMRKAPPCTRRVIDISGDGVLNDGFPPASAYQAFPFEGITVNGLAIQGADPKVADYYRTDVIHGPGAFLEVARDYRDYPRVIKRKLLREVQGLAVSQADAR